jgi:hypothetical protein
MKFRELRIQKPRRPPTASELHFPVRIKVQRSAQQILYQATKPYQHSAIYDPFLENTVK